jgi:hypothetical protein
VGAIAPQGEDGKERFQDTKMKRIVPLIVALALLWPAAALAASGSGCNSSDQTYGSQICQVQSNTLQQTTTASNASGTLPFTGLDVGLLVVGGGVLLAGGLLVRWLSREA